MTQASPFSFPELLAPAGNLEKLRTAFFYGADAVYLGGASDGMPSFNLRASAEGLDKAALAEGLLAAAAYGGKVYYCLNSLPVERDLRHLPAVIEETAALGVHGFIIADPGVLRLARKYAPLVPVHLSTQANTCNGESVRFWAEQGVERVNLAREMHCEDIQAIRESCPNTELEVFVHGAMCLAVSGQCLLSAWLNDRPANTGRCTQPCRFEYRVFEERLRPGQPLWTVTEEQGYSNIWAPDDLCLLPYLPWFIHTGINALKIEGRMKGPGYVAHVTDVYSTALAFLRQNQILARGIAMENGQPAAGQAAERAEHAGPEGCEEEAERLAAFFDWKRYMPDLLYTASRPLSTGFFLANGRRYLGAEYVNAVCSGTEPGMESGAACLGMTSSAARLGAARMGVSSLISPEGLQEGSQSPFAYTAQPLLAKIVEPVDGSGGARGWRMEVRGAWREDMAVEIMLPGMHRPVLQPGGYALENHRGERAASVGSGIRGILHTDTPHIVPGCFIRASMG